MIDRYGWRLVDMDAKEFGWVALLAFLFAFVLTFRLWGVDTFDPSMGIQNLLSAFLGLFFIVFFHEAGHKLAAAREGYEARIEPFGPGLAISVFVALYSQGFLPLITPNLVACDARSEQRVGHMRKYDNPSNMARIALGGLVGSALAIMCFKLLYLWTGWSIVKVIILGGVLHMFFSLIPWELMNLVKLRYFEKAESYIPGDGLHIIWWSRPAYLFSLILVVIFGGFALITNLVSVYLVVTLALITAFLMNKWLGL